MGLGASELEDAPVLAESVDAAAAARGAALLLAGGLALGDKEALALRIPQDAGPLDHGCEALEQALLCLAITKFDVQRGLLSRGL